tara:strand:- start:99 stop:488 length:390 start_codon:yes stop_codon:yes gene_type:complete
MAEMSNYLEIKLLNLTLNGTSYAGMNNPFVSLHTTDPTDAGTPSTEKSGGSYTRVAASFATASTGVVATDADVTFPTATTTLGIVAYIGLWDAVSGGNMLYHTALDTPKTLDVGDIFKIQSGNLTVELA